MRFKIKTGRILMPWWINPVFFLVGFVLPMFVLISVALLGSQGSPTIAFQYSAPVYADLSDIALILTAILALAGGAAITGGLSRTADIHPGRSSYPLSEMALNAIFAITVAAYTVWFGAALINNPALIIGALTGSPGASYAVRANVDTIPGITTLTQFGVSYVLIVSALIGSGIAIKARFVVFAAIIFSLALFRAAVWSERIALIELAFPLFVVFAARFKVPGAIKPAIGLGPYFGAAVMPLVFVAFEINRSWNAAYSRVYSDVFQFTFDRISIYYTSAINNGIGFIKASANPTFTGEYSFGWLYQMPFIGQFAYELTGADAKVEYAYFLKRSADIEFNNHSGIALIAHDWGWPLAIVFFFAYGCIVGLSFSSFRKGLGVMGAMFPLFLYAIYEVMRIGYVNEPRFLVAFLGVAIYFIWSNAHANSAPREFSRPHIARPR